MYYYVMSLCYANIITFHYANVIMLLYVYVCRETSLVYVCIYVCLDSHIYAGGYA